jgi:anti-anti-sigma factor
MYSIKLNENHLGLSDKGNLIDLVNSEIALGNKEFEFDLTELSSLNSAGIGILIGCRKAILGSGGELKLMNVNEKIAEIFRLTKIDGLFGLK